jgi:hypothetical protein
VTIDHLTHRFVKSVPEQLESGVLYVSIEYDTTIHLCACGCGNQVVLPLHPTAWRLTYNGETVSMAPSVGNWSFPCRSHYWIERGQVRWAPAWTDDQVTAGRERTLRERGVALKADDEERPQREPSVWQRMIEAAKRFLGHL